MWGVQITNSRAMPDQDLTRCGRSIVKGKGKKIHHSWGQKKPPAQTARVGWSYKTRNQEERRWMILRSDWGEFTTGAEQSVIGMSHPYIDGVIGAQHH